MTLPSLREIERTMFHAALEEALRYEEVRTTLARIGALLEDAQTAANAAMDVILGAIPSEREALERLVEQRNLRERLISTKWRRRQGTANSISIAWMVRSSSTQRYLLLG